LVDIVRKHCTVEIMISDFLQSALSNHCRLRGLLLPRITLCRTPYGREIDPSHILYLTTYVIRKGQASIHPSGFEPVFPGSEWPQTHA